MLYEFNNDLHYLHSAANYANLSAECNAIESKAQKHMLVNF